jgi:hypothetical protein
VFILSQVALQRLIQDGITIIKNSPEVLDDIFCMYTIDELSASYGQAYIDQIKTWFVNTKIPVVQAWSLNPQTAPMIGIKLATDQEDVSNAAIGDYLGPGTEGETGVLVQGVQLDIVIQTTKNGDEALWLYYIVCYILMKRKRTAEALGFELHTWNASDYNRNASVLADNIWQRYIRFSAKIYHTWEDRPYLDIDDVAVDLYACSTSGDGEKEKL